MFDFSNMTVIVTGSGAGMGREAAKLFAKYGANVVVNSTSATCEDARAEIETAGGSVMAVCADVGTMTGCKTVIDETVKRFGDRKSVV